jgi:hypothetical protein
MAEPLSSLIRSTAGPALPGFERLATPPAESVLAAELAARTAPGDVVLDLHARGGWVARNAIGALRRVYAWESSPLTRLLAEVVLRPPDLRHFDAAVSTMAVHPRGDVGLQQALTEPFSSRCPTCGRPVVVDEFIWEADGEVPARKVFRCSFCRDQARGHEQRTAPTDDEDAARARSLDPHPRERDLLRDRFPTPDTDHSLPDQILDLYTPRTVVALEAITTRVEADLRAAPITAAMRLALVLALLPLSRLNSYPGRVAALRIQNGRVKSPPPRQWRERNPWLVFEEGCRQVRTFVQRLEVSTGTFQPRPGEDLGALIDGAANIVLRTGSPAQPGNEPTLAMPRSPLPGRLDPRSRVRLVLTQPPVHWGTENLSLAYLATSVVLGRHDAASLPLEGIFGPAPKNEWARVATTLRRSLMAVRPVLAPDANAVVVLDRGGAESLVAGVLGGVGAGFQLSSALLSESGSDISGILEFGLNDPDAADADADRDEVSGVTPANRHGAFQLSAVEQAVSGVAVAVLQARGEPASFERLLGEVLVGLDRLGHLRRLVGTRTFAETEAKVEESVGDEAPTGRVDSDAIPPAEPGAGADEGSDGPPSEPEAASPAPAWEIGAASSADHVGLFMEIVMSELRRPDHARLVELEPGRWWLRNGQDIAAARQPLSDRLEWAVFGLLSTVERIDEEAFFERVARMFRGNDAPDQELVRAILESYRDPSAPANVLRTLDSLAQRHEEHGTLVGLLVEYGHRLGLHCWTSPREQRRPFRGGTVGDLLTEEERRTYLPLVTPGDAHTLESMDCIWYLRGKATFLFEVEWTAMLAEPMLRRGPLIPTDDKLVRFLVIPPERAELVRLKLQRSPVLREAQAAGNWHILKTNHLRRLTSRDEASLDELGPLLGLDPEVERQPEQLALFE